MYWKVPVWAMLKIRQRNMVLTLSLDKSFLVASWGRYVASIQRLQRDKLKYQVSQQVLSHDMTFMSRQRLHYTITVKHLDTAKGAFQFDYLWSITKCCNICSLRLVALYKILTMILTSFLCSKCSIGVHELSVKIHSAKNWLCACRIC